MSLVKPELKTFVADIQHDNGATVVRKTAICQAPDRATAASRIAREVEKTSEDTIYFLYQGDWGPCDCSIKLKIRVVIMYE